MTSWLVPWRVVINKVVPTKKPVQVGRLFDWQAEKFTEPPGSGPNSGEIQAD